MAYPERAEEVRENIACAQFINAINDGFIKRTLQLEGITILKLAIERVIAIKIINDNSFQKRKNQNYGNNSKQNKKDFIGRNLKEADKGEKMQGKINKEFKGKWDFNEKR